MRNISHLERELHLFQVNTGAFDVSEHRNNSFLRGLSLTYHLVCSGPRNLTLGEAQVLPATARLEEGSGLPGLGMERDLCGVFSGSLREHLCGAASPSAQQCDWHVERAAPAAVHRADGARIAVRRKGQGRLPKNVHPDPFSTDARRLLFAFPYARADLLVSLSAQPANCLSSLL